jgi:Fe-S cluster assembly iron-binding protein IscA
VLTLTENACDVVKTITEQSTQTEGAGLRISPQETDPSALTVAPAESPMTGDQVVEESGARIFLEENAAVVLDDKVLDAQVDQSGGVQFALGTQPGE